MPPRSSARRPLALAVRWLAAASVLAACTPKPAEPDEQTTPESTPEAPPEPITFSASGLPSRALPEASAKATPPLRLTASDGTGLRLLKVDARASVQEPLAFTELHLTFENPEARTIEGRFSIDLPPGAAISRFAMKIGDQWQEGEVVERQAARRVYEDFLHRRQDPALMEKEAGNRFSARVFPIQANRQKELIVSYSQQLTDSSEPYRMMLAGLPKLDQLDARILIDTPEDAADTATPSRGIASTREIIEVHERDYTPDHDLEVVSHAPREATGIRNDELAMARVVVGGKTTPEAIDDLTILFDTSASRALDFDGQVRRLGQLVAALRDQQGDFTLRVAAFDQDVSLLFDGPAADFGDEHLEQLFSRRALGASDLASALHRASTITGTSGRVLLITDGVSTVGQEQKAALIDAAKGLTRVGVTRVDAILDGGLQDRAALEAITTAGLPRDGIVADGRLPAARLAEKIRLSTLSDLKVSVDGAAWSWPRMIDGVQPGDEVLVYAQLPKDAAMTVALTGEQTLEQSVPLTAVDRPLLYRAWIGARIDALTLQMSKLPPTKDDKSREHLRSQIIELSTKNRVLSDYTALLVLETEHDYRRYDLDRRGLANILVVGPDGLEWHNRRKDPIPTGRDAIPQMARGFDPESMKVQGSGLYPPPNSRRQGGKKGGGDTDEDVWGGPIGSEEIGEPFGLNGFDPEGDPIGYPEVGESIAVDGLGLVGSGRGGGGTSDRSSDNVGLIGHGGGGKSGSSGYGRARTSAGDKLPKLRMAKPTIKGPVERDIVRRITRAHLNELRYCYNQGLHRLPKDDGKVSVQYTINLAGKVPVAVVQSTSLRDSQTAQCFATTIKRWKFPKPKSPGLVLQPFVLSLPKGYVPLPQHGTRKPLTPAQMAERAANQHAERERARHRQAQDERARAEAERTLGSPYEGRMYDVMTLIDDGKPNEALTLALGWMDESPGDVVALLAVGEALEAMGRTHAAARAYGSLIDLFPARADLRRHAGSRLESLGDIAQSLAVDTYTHAVAQRSDHPSSHRLLAFALVRAHRHEEAFNAIQWGLSRSYPEDRFASADKILREDAGLIGAAWLHAEPHRAMEINKRAREAKVTISSEPSTRFVMIWETDTNDVDFHIRDQQGGHAYYASRQLPSGGRLYDDVTTGYGPECFAIEGQAQGFPYRFNAHYYSRGPMGYGMGTLQIIEHDGEGTLLFEDRPYLIMKDRAEAELGELTGPLSKDLSTDRGTDRG